MEFFDLLVKERGKKKELRMLKAEARSAFGDAAFAENDTLVAASEGLANQGPLFESEGHGKAAEVPLAASTCSSLIDQGFRLSVPVWAIRMKRAR